MFYCPRCKAAVLAESKFCGRCGLNRDDAQRLSAPSNTANSENVPSWTPDPSPSSSRSTSSKLVPGMQLPPVPTRVMQPGVKRVPARPHSGSFPSQPPSLATSASQNQGAERIQPTPAPMGNPLNQAPQSGQSLDQTPTQPTQLSPEQAALGNRSAPASQQQAYQPVQPVMEGTRPPQNYRSPLVDVPTSQLPIEVIKGRPPLIETHEQFPEDDEGAESYIATSVAAEHWRTSWRNRQRNEAGPATFVSRGQATVSEPLQSMQHSLARMRAILLPKKPPFNLRFWIILVFMLCLLGGLVFYIAASFQTKADTTAQSIQQSAVPLPDLSVQGTPAATVRQGQSLPLHGKNFDIGAPIIFLLDNAIAVNGSNGLELSVLVSDQGTFDVSMPVSRTWPAGPHMIQAYDNKNNQSAYLNFDITLAGTATTTNPNLTLSSKLVTFHAMVGQGEPPEQFVTLTNTSTTSAIQWTAQAKVENNLTWLDIDETTTSGNLKIGGTATLGIRAMTAGLTANTPYSGNIVITLNQNVQLTLPVSLQLDNGPPEIAINPNPLPGVLSATGDSCQPNTTLLLINLSNQPVSWSLSINSTAATHIAFLLNGQPYQHGVLAPSGQQTDSTLLTLQCTHVKVGETFHFTITAGTLARPEVVNIQATP